MSNPYYNASGNPVTLTRGASSVIRSEYSAVENGFTNFSNAIPSIVADAVAVGGIATNCTSTTSNTIANSVTLTFTVETGKPFVVGMTIKFASTASPTNSVTGDITSYDSETGIMIISVSSYGGIGSGTFSNWTGSLAYTPVPILTYPSVTTGEVVASGNLLAIDDSGNSQSATAITTAVLQAVTTTSFHACNFGSTNTAIFWTAGSTDVRMMTITKNGGAGLASTSVATGLNQTLVWSSELTSGNIVLVYLQITTGYPVFKILSNSGTQIVAETVIESVAAVGQIKCCALTGGGFAVIYNTAANNRYAVYTNAGGVTKAAATNVAGAQTRVAICSTAAGGFVALAGTTSLTGFIWNAAGTTSTAAAIGAGSGTSSNYDVNIASKSGSIAATARRESTPNGGAIGLASDTANSVINSVSSGSVNSIPYYKDLLNQGSSIGVGHIAVLGNGNYVATFSAGVSSSEYPRYVIFNDKGMLVDCGVCFEEITAQLTPVYVIPKDTNGFSLIWLAANQNIKFAQVKSGKVIGVSLGQIGSNTQYISNGEVTLSNNNMLNVGASAVNFSRQGTKVVV